MKYTLFSPGLLVATALVGNAQAPVIRSSDMFNAAGLYYRACANVYDSSDPTTAVPASNLMGTAGDSQQYWDFFDGPTNEIHRFDYLYPGGLPEAVDFPEATLAERKTTEVGGDVSYLFYSLDTGVGRRVYGFYDPAFGELTVSPVGVFSPPITDFPAQIHYGDGWSTSTAVFSDLGVVDPEISVIIPAKFVFSSEFKADAWGVVLLPGIGPVTALRVNETQTMETLIDWDGVGQYEAIDTQYTRNYYWLSPGRGIVAQLNSTPSGTGTVPVEQFSQAASFLRMFDTNKEYIPGGDDPEPVTDLQLVPGNGLLVIRWSKAANASRYQVLYSNGDLQPSAWQALGAPTSNSSLLDPDGMSHPTRFYRVISLP